MIKAYFFKEPKIATIPAEVIQNYVFPYLFVIDIYNFGRTGNKKLKEISEDYIGRYCKLGKLFLHLLNFILCKK